MCWYIGNPELTGTKLYKFNGNYSKFLSGLELLNNEVNNKYKNFSKQIENSHSVGENSMSSPSAHPLLGFFSHAVISRSMSSSLIIIILYGLA